MGRLIRNFTDIKFDASGIVDTRGTLWVFYDGSIHERDWKGAYTYCPRCTRHGKPTLKRGYCSVCDATGIDGLIDPDDWPGRVVSVHNATERATPTKPRSDVGSIELPDGRKMPSRTSPLANRVRRGGKNGKEKANC